MNKYKKYKDIGFDWIGEIPEHWEVRKLKYLALIENANAFLYDKASVILRRKGTIDKPQFIEVLFWAVDTTYYTIVKENASQNIYSISLYPIKKNKPQLSNT